MATPDPDDAGPSGLPRLEIPDDARALDGDRWRYYDELHRQRKMESPPGGPAGPDHPGTWRDGKPWFGLFGSSRIPLMFAIAACLAMAASFLLPLIQRPNPPKQTEALALETGPVGREGGLLPVAQVQLNGGERDLRDIRPAVVAVVPVGDCPGCRSALSAASRTAQAVGYTLVIADTASDAPAAEVGASEVAADPDANVGRDPVVPRLIAAAGTFDPYAPEGLTLLVVTGDGTVASVIRDADVGSTAEGSLQQALNNAQ